MISKFLMRSSVPLRYQRQIGRRLFSDIKYTQSHEYVNTKTHEIGISEFAAKELGDVVYVDLPEVGTQFEKGEVYGSIESVKAAADVYMPISGVIKEVNSELEDSPSLINESPLELGWIVKVDSIDQADVSNLMDQAAYDSFAKSDS